MKTKIFDITKTTMEIMIDLFIVSFYTSLIKKYE